MAWTDARATGYLSGLEMGPAAPNPCVPPCHCAIAIGALESASDAIACADIEARCKAVGAATEATTSLFLELDGINLDVSALATGRLYESILGRLVHINLHNDPKVAHETIAMIERLRCACARWGGPGSPPTRTAVHRSEP